MVREGCEISHFISPSDDVNHVPGRQHQSLDGKASSNAKRVMIPIVADRDQMSGKA